MINPKITIYEDGYAFNSETGESFFVNETGRLILEFLKSGKDFEEIATYFTTEYDVSLQDFERFYFEFLDILKNYQLLK
jgi:hypothetical protein